MVKIGIPKHYDVYDEQNGGVLYMPYATTKEVADRFQISMHEVRTRAENKEQIQGRFLVVEAEPQDSYMSKLYGEWDTITKQLRHRIVWCAEGTKGARRIHLKPRQEPERRSHASKCYGNG